MSVSTPRLLLGSLVLVVAAALAGYLGAALALSLAVPAEAAGVLSIVVMVLVTGLGCLVLARRWPPAGPVDLAAGLAAPVLLGLVTGIGSQTPLWFRLVVLAAFVGTGLAALRSGARDADDHLAPARSDQGAGSLEFVGIVIAAALLVVATVGAVSTSSPAVRDTIWARICQITGGDCSPAQLPSNHAYKPTDCEVRTSETKINATVDITFVRLGGGAVVQRVEKANGDVEITILKEGEGGAVAAGGAHGGFRVGDTSVGFDWEAELAGTIGLQAGETYVFDNAEDATSFQNYIQGEVVEDAVTSVNPVLKAGNWIVEKVTREKPPSNNGVQKQFVRLDAEVTASASAEFGYGSSGSIEGSAMRAIGLENDRGADGDDPSDDRRTLFYQMDWGVALDVGLPAVKGIDASHSASGVVKVTFDDAGNITEVGIVDRAEGSFDFGLAADENSVTPVGADPKGTLQSWNLAFKAGPSSSVVVTQTLEIDSPEEERAAAEWLLAAGGANVFASAGLSTVPVVVDSTQGENITTIGGGEGFADLIGTQGKVSIVEYDGTTWGFGGGLGLSLAAKASVDLSYDDKEANAVKAAYLGAPDSAGSRSAYGLPECVG